VILEQLPRHARNPATMPGVCAATLREPHRCMADRLLLHRRKTHASMVER
jgi:hypothetical protein